MRTIEPSIVTAARVLLVAAMLPAPLAMGQVSGSVVDSATGAPVAGALVGAQASDWKTTTARDGTFALPNATGSGLVVVAAMEGYYNTSLNVNAPVSGVLFTMEAVPPSNHAGYSFVDPSTCGSCHPDQFAQWTDSPMSHAGTNLWVYDIYDGTGTPGGMGGFVYQNDSVYAAANPESECASCHQPEPWIETPFSGLEDLGSLSTGAMHGVSCDICHKIAHIDESKVNFPGIYPGTVDFRRPGPNDSQVQFGVLGDTSFELFSLMRPSYQPQLRAAMCAACHQDKNDPDEDHDFEEANGVISEPTYLEWLASPYADPTDPHAADCVDCHMPAYGATNVSNQSAAPDRDPETIRHHRIEGTTARYLENAVELSVACAEQDGELHVGVTITNTQTGHHVPTGVTIRNMILLVEAIRVSTGEVLPSLGDQVVHELGGVGAPSQGYYAGLPGKLYAKVNHDRAGHGPTFFTDATGILWDNRIPALASDVTQYRFRLPPGGEDLRVRARLIYRRAFRGFVDAKRWASDGHGNPLEDIAPPYYGHLMEEVVCDWPGQ